MKAIVFDIDGVLVDTVGSFYTAYNEAMKSVGSYITEKEYLDRVHLQGYKIFEEILKIRGIEADAKELNHLKNKIVNNMLKNAKLKKGVNEILKMLSENNIKYCIATASEREQTEIILNAVGISHLFPIVVTASDTEDDDVKPNIYYIAADRLKEPIENCVLVEDSLHNIKVGKSIGMGCIGVIGKYSKEGLKEAADYVVGHVGEIKTEWLR
ncbi:MAG: HAD family phosphatase [Candidatus Diapherotrites archaeon]|nr:HAD family phosphatase [Candidatus Diapherotrites archaeon]